MAGGLSVDEDETISGINVTPLVDVILVLLIIFMITAPAIYQSAIQIQLPKTKTGETTNKSPLNFIITKKGELLLDQENLDWNSLSQKLKNWGPSIVDQTALISADEGTLHGTVIKLMDTLREAGLTRFALNVDKSAEMTSK